MFFLGGASLRAKAAIAVVAIVYGEAAWIFSFGPWIKRRLRLEYSTTVDMRAKILPSVEVGIH